MRRTVIGKLVRTSLPVYVRLVNTRVKYGAPYPVIPVHVMGWHVSFELWCTVRHWRARNYITVWPQWLWQYCNIVSGYCRSKNWTTWCSPILASTVAVFCLRVDFFRCDIFQFWIHRDSRHQNFKNFAYIIFFCLVFFSIFLCQLFFSVRRTSLSFSFCPVGSRSSVSEGACRLPDRCRLATQGVRQNK